jgi:hypothetical protein
LETLKRYDEALREHLHAFSPGRPDGRVFFAFQNRTSPISKIRRATRVLHARGSL